MATRWQRRPGDGARLRRGRRAPVRRQAEPPQRHAAAAQAGGGAGPLRPHLHGHVNVFWTRPQSYYDSADWRGTWEFDGGAFMNQASHYVDLLDWLVGPVESVQAYTGTLARNIEVEDTGVAALKWRNGALGSINVTMLTYPKNLEGSITILGEKGTRAHRRRGGQRDRALGVRRQPHPMDAAGRATRATDDLGLRLRPPAVLRQRDQARCAARRSPRPTAARG